MKPKGIACVTFGLAGLTSTAFSQPLIDVALGNGSATPSGAAVLGAAGDIWNAFDGSAGGSFGPLTLVDTTGATTGVSLSFSCEGAVAAANPPSQPLPALTHYYVFNNTAGSITASLTGLVPNQQYNLLIYCASDDGGGALRSANINANGVITSPTCIPTPTFVNGSNYVGMTVTADGSGAINITESNANNPSMEVDLNGLQLQGVPEPAPIAAIGLGLVAIIARRRKCVRRDPDSI